MRPADEGASLGPRGPRVRGEGYGRAAFDGAGVPGVLTVEGSPVVDHWSYSPVGAAAWLKSG